MPDRLSALDASFLYLEDQSAPMHVGGVAVFRRPRSGFGYEHLLALIERRLAAMPRYRQRVLSVPGHLARPVWVDDPDFDLAYHVRRSALPRPGTDAQLHELVARLISRPLDHTRPLWEVYLVEDLARGHFALVTKTHQALVDGVRAVDIGQVILDSAPRISEPDAERDWRPRPRPGWTRLVLDAITDNVRRPAEVIENVRSAATDALATAQKLAGAVGGVAAVLGAAASPAPDGPLNVRISHQRRFAVARARLADLRAARTELTRVTPISGGVRLPRGTVHDVVLAVVAGALRSWLLSRGEAVTSSATVRALVPLAVRPTPTDGAGHSVRPHLVDLPVGEPNPVLRFQHISHAMRADGAARAVAAGALLAVGGFAPPTLHSLGARAAGSLSRRVFNVLVTNVPGAQSARYAGNARMTEIFPVMPLIRHQALAIGVTSYDGGVYFGLTGDRDAMSDVDVLATMLEESVEELVTAVSTG